MKPAPVLALVVVCLLGLSGSSHSHASPPEGEPSGIPKADVFFKKQDWPNAEQAYARMGIKENALKWLEKAVGCDEDFNS